MTTICGMITSNTEKELLGKCAFPDYAQGRKQVEIDVPLLRERENGARPTSPLRNSFNRRHRPQNRYHA